MAQLLTLGRDKVSEIIKRRLYGTFGEEIEEITFAHDNEFVFDSPDGIEIIIEGKDNTDIPFEETVEFLDVSNAIEKYIRDLGWFIIGIRYFTIYEGIGVVAIVKPRG